MDLLTVDYEVRPGAVVVQAKGEIDSSTVSNLARQLQAALQQATSRADRLLIVDLQNVTYFGSAGLNAVLDCHRAGLKTGTHVRLVADNALVVRPIEVTNLNSVLDLYPTLPEALQGRDTESRQ
jgi:anti-anti-sigma factor